MAGGERDDENKEQKGNEEKKEKHMDDDRLHDTVCKYFDTVRLQCGKG